MLRFPSVRVRLPAAPALCATILGVMPASSIAQDPVVLAVDTGAAGFDPRAERIVRLGSADGPGFVGARNIVAEDARGRYLVGFVENPGRVMVFDSGGEYLTTVGREGSGPGEYGFIEHLIPTASTVNVFDTNGRRTVLSLDWDVLHTNPSPLVRYSSIALPDDSIVVMHAMITTPEKVGVPFHIMRHDGSVLRSFGDVGEPYRRDRDFASRRVIAPGAGQTIWAVKKTEYVVQRWSLSGGKTTEMVRDVDWLRPHHQAPNPDPEMPLRPFVAGLWLDAAGRMWTLILVADPEWERALTPTPYHRGCTYTDESRFFDSVVEVIDVDRGVVLASRRFDEAFSPIAGSDKLASNVESTAGIPYLDVWRVHRR